MKVLRKRKRKPRFCVYIVEGNIVLEWFPSKCKLSKRAILPEDAEPCRPLPRLRLGPRTLSPLVFIPEGMIGIVTDAALSHGGSVWGVITRPHLSLDFGPISATDLEVEDSVRKRKSMMAVRATLSSRSPAASARSAISLISSRGRNSGCTETVRRAQHRQLLRWTAQLT